jgi:hypothetical protein
VRVGLMQPLRVESALPVLAQPFALHASGCAAARKRRDPSTLPVCTQHPARVYSAHCSCAFSAGSSSITQRPDDSSAASLCLRSRWRWA